jgi:hypothetical protein
MSDSIAKWARALALGSALAGTPFLHAQTPPEAEGVMVVPIAAHTASYGTEVYIRNGYFEPLFVDVVFFEANNSSVPGQRPCAPLWIPARSTHTFTLDAQCTLGPGSHFGMLILLNGYQYFTAYSRTQTPAGVGLAVEGVPYDSFSAAPAFVEGLKRTATGAKYLSNCFVGSLYAAVDYRIDVLDGNDVPIGSPIEGSLDAYQIVRYLDILDAAGAPAGDYADVRVKFTETGAGSPWFVGFCTMQESVTFGADFRIAKRP